MSNWFKAKHSKSNREFTYSICFNTTGKAKIKAIQYEQFDFNVTGEKVIISGSILDMVALIEGLNKVVDEALKLEECIGIK